MSYRYQAVQLSTGESVRGLVRARSLRDAEDVAEASVMLRLRADPGDVLVRKLNEVAPPMGSEVAA